MLWSGTRKLSQFLDFSMLGVAVLMNHTAILFADPFIYDSKPQKNFIILPIFTRKKHGAHMLVQVLISRWTVLPIPKIHLQVLLQEQQFGKKVSNNVRWVSMITMQLVSE